MSRGLNKVMIIGNIGREPELRFTHSGKAVASFSVAVSRRWVDSRGDRREETEWFNVVAWGNLAEICDQYLTKGGQVYVEGRLQTRKWENEFGHRQVRTDVVANEVTILSQRHRSRHQNRNNHKHHNNGKYHHNGNHHYQENDDNDEYDEYVQDFYDEEDDDFNEIVSAKQAN